MPQINETELCNKIIYPYLKSLNISSEQIKLEQSFMVRLGHTKVDLNGKSRNKLSGRLDVLVTDSEGNNLFVIELKAPDNPLTDDDAEQGISYARLLEQIAPFVIVSNGRKTKVYDTVTKERIHGHDLAKQSAFWSNGRQLSTENDINVRFEALQRFFGYSSDNVELFCYSQNKRGMLALKGAQSNRKYNTATYIKRKRVYEAVSCFIENNSVAFALIGESGVGKTNEMCALTQEISKKHIVIFINATEIIESIERTISDEFNWGFSESIKFQEIVKRLCKLGNSLCKKIVIVVDAIDESVAPNFDRSVSDLASKLSSTNGTVKLIVSSKISDWKRFSQFKGTISKLNLLLDTSWYLDDIDEHEDPKPFVLTTFDEHEKRNALEAYSNFYNLAEFPEGSVKQACKHPFLLRVVSELHSNKKLIPNDLSEERLIESWVERKLIQLEDPDSCRLVLIAIAQAIYKESIEKEKTQVTYGELWRASSETILDVSNVAETNAIYKQLESVGVITSQSDYKQILHYSYYYGPIRDYFIARYVLKLDELSAEKLSLKLKDILNNSILRSALFWHLRKAPHDQVLAVKEVIYCRAAEFIKTYNDIVNHLIPGLKANLPPYNSNNAGICFINKGEWLEFGLYPIIDNKQENVIELVNSRIDKGFYNELSSIGAIFIGGGGVNLLNEDPQIAAAQYASTQIQSSIKKGNLNEVKCKTTLREGVLAIISTNEFLCNESLLSRDIYKNLPLELQEINNQIQIAFGREFYRNKWIGEECERQRKANPSQSFYSIPQMPIENKNKIEHAVESDVRAGKTFPPPNISGQESIKAIPKLLEQLISHNDKTIELVLPNPDKNKKNDFRRDYIYYSDETLSQYINQFFTKAFSAYETIAKLNFSGLTHKLTWLGKMPFKVYVDVMRYTPDDWSLCYIYQLKSNGESDVIINLGSEKSFLRESDGEFVVDGKVADFYQICHCDLESIFSSHDGLGYDEDYSYVDSATPIRAFVYRLLKEDIEGISAEELLNELKLIAT